MKSLCRSPNNPEQVSAYCSQHALRLHRTTKTASGSPHNKDNGRRPIGAPHSTKQKPLLPSGFLSSSVADLAVNQLDGSKKKTVRRHFSTSSLFTQTKRKKKRVGVMSVEAQREPQCFLPDLTSFKGRSEMRKLWNNFV